MAGYASSTLALISGGGIGGTAPRIWFHTSTDAASVVDTTGYITDGGDRGMKVGDILIHVDSDATEPLGSMFRVKSVSATAPGAVNLQDGTTVLSGTDTD